MNRTLFPLLATFNNDEWKNFGKYLESYHSVESKIYKVFLFLKERKTHVEDFSDIEKWRTDYFPDIQASGFVKLISKLFLESEDFIASYTIINNEAKKDLLLNEIYNNRAIYHLANRKANKISNSIKSIQGYSISQNKTLTTLLHQQCYSDNPIKYDKNSKLQQELFGQFFRTIQFQSLVYLCEAQNWGTIRKIDLSKDINLLQNIINLIPDSELSLSLKMLIKVIVELDVISFLEVRNEVYDGKFLVTSNLHTIITMYLINSCIKLWRKGTYVDSNENAKLIEYGLSTGVLTSSGKIPLTRFLNLLSTLGKLKTFKWNEEFIERWIDKVDTNSQQSTHAFAKALNAFNFGKYEEIYDLIRDVEFENFSDKIRALGLEMISLYIDRKENYYVLRNFISNYKRTLKRAREKMSSTNVKSYLNLVKVIELLIQKDFRRLTIRVEKYQPIAYRTWVLEEVGRREGV